MREFHLIFVRLCILIMQIFVKQVLFAHIGTDSMRNMCNQIIILNHYENPINNVGTLREYKPECLNCQCKAELPPLSIN